MEFTNSASSWPSVVKRQVVGAFSVVLIVGSAALLTLQTLDLEHSCHPLLNWAEVTATDCPSVLPQKLNQPSGQRQDDDSSTQRSDKHNSKPQPKGSDSTTTSTNRPKDPSGSSSSRRQKSDSKTPDSSGSGTDDKSGPDVKEIAGEVAGVVAGAAAITGLAIVGAPVAIAAGAGVAVWWAARTLLKG